MKELHINNVINARCLKVLGVDDVGLHHRTTDKGGSIVHIISLEVTTERQNNYLPAIYKHGSTPCFRVHTYQRQCHSLHPTTLRRRVELDP